MGAQLLSRVDACRSGVHSIGQPYCTRSRARPVETLAPGLHSALRMKTTRPMLLRGVVVLTLFALGCSPSSAHDAPTVSSFSAAPESLPYGGGTVTLSWMQSGASGLEIDPAVGDVSGRTSVQVHVAQSTTFTLTASNDGGSAMAAATVTVQPQTKPSISSFSASPMALPPGGGLVTLEWVQDGGAQLSIDNGVGDVSGLTSTQVEVTKPTTFMLTASNDAGASEATVSIMVDVPTQPPVITKFTASPAQLGILGGNTTLSWTVSEAVSLSIDGGVDGGSIGDVTGKTSVSVPVRQTTAFTLYATNAVGTSTAAATVNVYVPANPPSINNFQASPSQLPDGGGTVTLAWNVTDAETLSIDPGVGDVSGTIMAHTTVTSTTAFTLTATNVRGSSHAQVTVQVH
jgi:hypothetical protein